MIQIWSIDGRSYDDLPVIEFKCSFQILDGAGTARTQAAGWEMFRQPEGTILNVAMRIGVMNSNVSTKESFKSLINTLADFGRDDFKTISFVTPFGTQTQEMYSPSFDIEMQRITREGVTYWGSIPVVFIAKKAYIT